LNRGILAWLNLEKPESQIGILNPRILKCQIDLGESAVTSSLIPVDDLRVELARQRGAGGQQVGLTSTGVKVTHLPTGISATVELRSQHRSRQVAIEMLEAALTSPNFR
jgi:protein subunit release factor A